MRNEISNSDDVIDSRQVIERIEELQNNGDGTDDDEKAELAALLALQDEAEGYTSGDWPHGATLIRDSYFQEYAQELAEDCGDVKADAGWPGRHIDWEAAADELKQDYTEVDFDGVAYWVR